MRPSGVKRIAGWFRIRPPSEEKKPFASSAFTDNGSIVKDPKMTVLEDSKALDGSQISNESGKLLSEPEEKPKMSLLRKMCFFLSLNGYVAYVAVLLWAIPCRHPLCVPPQKDWEMNLNAVLTTNIEATKHSGLPYSVIFGYSDESGAHLAALAIADGKLMWNHSTEHIFRHVFCEFGVALEFNKSPGCIVTADNYIAAIEASNGNTIWQQNTSISEGEVIHRASLAKGPRNALYVFGVSDANLFVVAAENGTKLPAVALPCSWTVSIKLVGPWQMKKGNHWLLVCEYGDKLEVWTFEERKLLSPPEKRTGEGLRDDVRFSLLFSQDSYIGSIDLAGDVTRTPDSLALSWADIVVMVTAQAPFHHLQKTWERRFSGPLGDSLPVTSIVAGHFTDPEKNEIAVTVQDGLNTTIHILGNNGTTISSTNLGTASVMSMDRIPGGKRETDTIVIESVHPTHKAKKGNSSRDPSDQTTRSYFTMRYDGKVVKYLTLISSQVYVSSLSQFSEGVADLLTASKDSDGHTTINRLMITVPSQGLFCDSASNKNISTVLLLD